MVAVRSDRSDERYRMSWKDQRLIQKGRLHIPLLGGMVHDQ
jgi:hypothetical protein